MLEQKDQESSQVLTTNDSNQISKHQLKKFPKTPGKYVQETTIRSKSKPSPSCEALILLGHLMREKGTSHDVECRKN